MLPPGKTVAAALLVILFGLIADPSHVLAARTRTGIQVEDRCAQATRESIDKLNRLAGRAKIRWATCRLDGSLEKVGLRAVDGRDLQWQFDEGMDELSRRMMLGR
jgi:hypothetical protein